MSPKRFFVFALVVYIIILSLLIAYVLHRPAMDRDNNSFKSLRFYSESGLQLGNIGIQDDNIHLNFNTENLGSRLEAVLSSKETQLILSTSSERYFSISLVPNVEFSVGFLDALTDRWKHVKVTFEPNGIRVSVDGKSIFKYSF